MRLLPRKLELRLEDGLENILRRLAGWSRDVRASLRRLPDVEVLEFAYTGGATDFKVRTSFDSAPDAVLVAYVFDRDADATITAAVTAHWRFDAGYVVLRDVDGLTTDTKYTLRLLVLGV